MDKATGFYPVDCRFESCRGHESFVGAMGASSVANRMLVAAFFSSSAMLGLAGE